VVRITGMSHSTGTWLILDFLFSISPTIVAPPTSAFSYYMTHISAFRIQGCCGDNADLDHNRVNVLKRIKNFFWFLSVHESCAYTVKCAVSNIVLLKFIYLNLKILYC
jgi:hypothetical protein